METKTKCTKCGKVGHDDDFVTEFEDIEGFEYFHGCPNCLTDQHLIEVPTNAVKITK